MEAILAEFVKSNPQWTVLIVAIVLILPIPSHVLMTLSFLKFIKSALGANQVLFDRSETLHNKCMDVIQQNSKTIGSVLVAINKCKERD